MLQKLIAEYRWVRRLFSRNYGYRFRTKLSIFLFGRYKTWETPSFWRRLFPKKVRPTFTVHPRDVRAQWQTVTLGTAPWQAHLRSPVRLRAIQIMTGEFESRSEFQKYFTDSI